MSRRKKPVMNAETAVFSDAFKDSLRVLPMVQEMATADRYVCLDELCQRFPEIVNRYCVLALAGLRGLRKFEKQERQAKHSNAGDSYGCR